MSQPTPVLFDRLSDEFVAVPIAAGELQASIQICAVVRRRPDPASGHFVLLRRFPGGRVLLGCLRDHSDRVCDWLELWFQVPIEGDESVLAGNAAADERWDRLAAAMAACEPAARYKVPEEDAPALPSFVNPAALTPWHPNRDGRHLRVCTDDAILAAASLPKYSLSRARYGWLPALGAQSPFLPLTDGSPGAGSLQEEAGAFLPLNPTGGRMLVRKMAPVASEDFAALLAGVPWAGPDQSARHCRLSGPYALLSDPEQLRHGGRHYFAGRSGAAGRMAEALHLKLQLAWQCMKLVRDYTARLQLPMLNLSAESFRVRLSDSGLELPLLWSGSATLVQPGVAAPVPIPNTHIRYFKPLEPLRESIYRPEELARRRKGHATVRLRSVLPAVQEGTVLEATLVTPEDLRADQHELIELNLPLAERPITLYGKQDSKMAIGHGEVGFRTVPLNFSPAERATLQAATGVIFTQVPMEVQSPLSSPCDLYSLGVLTLRLLFAGSPVPIAQAKDNLFSLAASLTGASVGAADLVPAIREFLEGNETWREALGPHHLLAERQPDAAALIPSMVWAEVLALLLRLFPGRSPFAFRADLADAPGLALETVYDAPLAALRKVLNLTRSLHLLDWTQNREISQLIAAWRSRG
jgi:hypothetical protein